MRRQAGYQLLEPSDWKSQLRERAAGGDLAPAVLQLAESVALMRAAVCDVKAIKEDGDRVLEFVISDGSVDRDFDRVNPKGWDLKAYRKNPVVLWAHDSRQLPIARSLSVKLEEDQLVARAEFTPFELNPLGDMVFQLLSQKFLRTASVGFRPTAVNPAEEEERRQRWGMNFEKQELLEWSVVPIPANAQALLRAHDAGINTRPLKAWAEQVLDMRTPLPGLGINDVENAWKAVKGPDRLIVWVDAEIAAPEPAAADPDPEKGADPAPAPAAVELISFRRRPTGDYDVLRSGAPVLVVENPDAVEWDADGVLRLADADDEPAPAADDALLVDLEAPADEPDPNLIQLEGPIPEAPAPAPEPAPALSLDDLVRAIGQVVGERIASLTAR
jgi:HK97 family phage prohead protease